MPLLRRLVFALIATLSAPLALAQCPEPSALDLDAGATPLRVAKSGSSDLSLSWESVAADGFLLHEGTLDSLWSLNDYDHVVVADSVGATLVRSAPAGDGYFLVNSGCDSGRSGVGRDSADIERPFGGLAVLAVSLQGGFGVNGSQFAVTYPAAELWTEMDFVSFSGPYAPGSPGSPFGAINANEPGIVRVAELFGSANPDPSFDPPPDEPLEIAEIRFGYLDAAPTIDDFVLAACSTSDNLGSPVPDVVCLLSRLDILP